MKSSPDTLSVSQRIRYIFSGQRYSHTPISCLAALKLMQYIFEELRHAEICFYAQMNSLAWKH